MEKESAGSEKDEIKGSENVFTETSSDQPSSSDNNVSCYSFVLFPMNLYTFLHEKNLDNSNRDKSHSPLT